MVRATAVPRKRMCARCHRRRNHRFGVAQRDVNEPVAVTLEPLTGQERARIDTADLSSAAVDATSLLLKETEQRFWDVCSVRRWVVSPACDERGVDATGRALGPDATCRNDCGLLVHRRWYAGCDAHYSREQAASRHHICSAARPHHAASKHGEASHDSANDEPHFHLERTRSLRARVPGSHRRRVQ